jgi:hypothetical protein
MPERPRHIAFVDALMGTTPTPFGTTRRTPPQRSGTIAYLAGGPIRGDLRGAVPPYLAWATCADVHEATARSSRARYSICLMNERGDRTSVAPVLVRHYVRETTSCADAWRPSTSCALNPNADLVLRPRRSVAACAEQPDDLFQRRPIHQFAVIACARRPRTRAAATSGTRRRRSIDEA